MGNVCAQIGRACLLCNGGEHHCERDDACLTFPYSSMDFFSAARNLILKEVVYKLVSLQLPPTLLCTTPNRSLEYQNQNQELSVRE